MMMLHDVTTRVSLLDVEHNEFLVFQKMLHHYAVSMVSGVTIKKGVYVISLDVSE
jgi:hypothetical protein